MAVGTSLQTPIRMMGPQAESCCSHCNLVDSCLQRGLHNKHLRRMKGRFGCLQWKNMMGVWEQYWAIQYWAVDKNCRILGPAVLGKIIVR